MPLSDSENLFRISRLIDSLALPKSAEHAIKVLVCLAVAGECSVTSGEAARCVGISPAQAAKTLHFLRWSGLARSRRGREGGYSLRQSPEEIHLGQVIQLFLPASDGDSSAPSDPIHKIWIEASTQSQEEWEQITIAELARRTAGQWPCPAFASDKNLGSDKHESASGMSARETKKSKQGGNPDATPKRNG